MRKAVRRIFIGCIFVAGLLLLAIPFNSMRQSSALKRYEEKLRKEGEKLDYHDLIPAKPATNKNGAPALLAAIDLLDTNSPLLRMERLMNFVKPGKARCLALQAQAVSYSSGFAYAAIQITNEWNVLYRELEKNSHALKDIEKSLQAASFDFGFNYGPLHFIELQEYLTKIKLAALWYQSASLIEMQHNKRLEAMENIRKAIRLGDILKENHTRSAFLVRKAIMNIALTTTWEILQMPDWREEELEQLQEIWETTNCSNDLVQYLEMDRALNLSIFNALLENDQTVGKALFAYDVTNHLEELVAINGVGAVWRGFSGEQNKFRFLEYSQSFIAVARRCLTNKSILEWQSGFQEYNKWRGAENKTGYGKTLFYAKYLLAFSYLSPLERDGVRFFQLQTAREMTLSAIALKRYSLRNGKLPETLEILAPEFLGKVPVDYMDGKPLRYSVKTNGDFLLYSVGVDGIDDGGDASPIKDWLDYSYYSFWGGRDTVWPSAATTKEIADYQKKQSERYSAGLSTPASPSAQP